MASFGLAMVFVLFTYGGWNEAAYLAGEVRDARRNMLKILVAGIVAVTALYLLVNLAYLSTLGMGGVRESKAVAADVMRLLAGEKGVVLIALVVCVSALTTMNAAIFTGARTTWAFAQDFPLFARLGAWRTQGSTPANALLLQGLISLLLVWRVVHPGRLPGHGRLHGARVLDLLPADRSDALRVPQPRRRDSGGADSVVSARPDRLRSDVRLHDLLDRQLCACRLRSESSATWFLPESS
jgi:amino acid transporter